jgi:hypothetical protein
MRFKMVAESWVSPEPSIPAASVRRRLHSIRGGHVRGIQQFGSPLSRARPEGRPLSQALS